MNSQEYHSLQEAYMNVYQEVDEAVYGGEQKKPKAPKDGRMVVTNADRIGNTPAYQNFKKGDPRYKAADHMGEETRELDEVRGGGKIDAVNRSVLAAINARSAEKRRLMNPQESYNPDLFDVILEYLIIEGYADTNENALVIMANMSEEWRESIVEGKSDQPKLK